MESELNLRIVLEKPPAGVDFGLQKGRGNDYETIQIQRSKGGDLNFDFTVRAKAPAKATGKGAAPNFLGPFVQGPTGERFVYIDIGTYAGQTETSWSRRLKIPLRGITRQMIEEVVEGKSLLETRVAGKGKDGSPSCATPKPFSGWKLIGKHR
ncbi:MAG: DUF5990 family protein [Acidobacteriota bacterium]|nr:DUF5990 family protein [Acidobacteriota bacterium]